MCAPNRLLKKTVGQGQCPLCTAFDPKVNVVIRQGIWWRYWRNPFPYKHHRDHFVLATIDHVTNMNNLPLEAFLELFAMVQEIIKNFELPGGAFAMRFGDLKYSAGTLTHLHAHVQVPDQTGPAMVVLCKKDPDFAAFLDHMNRPVT